MRMRLWLITCLMVSNLLYGGVAHAGTTERVSVSSTGEQGSEYANYPAISPDGRFVVFWCNSPDLIPGDSNGFGDVFVRDRLTGITERVSTSSSGAEGDDHSEGPTSISADGRYVAFVSDASNLVAADTNGLPDVFVRDRTAGTTERVNVSSTGEEGNGETYYAAISGDGRFVAFDTVSSNLVPGDTNGYPDAFVHDRLTGATERVSVTSAGGEMGASAWGTVLSADGRMAALTVGNGVFVRDRVMGTTECVSVRSDGGQADGESRSPAISADGRYVVFASVASNLIPGDTNGLWDVFVHDCLTGATERVSVSSSGEQGDSESGYFAPCDISGDGRFVVFLSEATNLTAGDTNDDLDAFVHDRDTGATMLVSRGNSDAQPGSVLPAGLALSANGRYVAFVSASPLVADDTNGKSDVYLRDLDGFPDVPFSQWAFPAISACFTSGIVSGYADGGYKPELSVTRDQLAVYISRALAGGDDNVPDFTDTPTFPDVGETHWALKYVEYAVDQSVVAGYDDGDYHPEYEVARDQMAVYVARAMVAPTGEAALADYVPSDPRNFPDVPSDFWAYKHIEYCVENDVVNGYEDGYYYPDAVVTRDQMAVYIARAFELPM